MAIYHIATMLCDNLYRTDTGKFIIAGMFKNISAPQLPISKPKCGFFVEFIGEPGDEYRVSIEGNGLDFLLAEGKIEEPIPAKGYQQGTIMVGGEANLSFAEPGVFKIVLRSGDEIIHSTSYGVVLTPEVQTNAE